MEFLPDNDSTVVRQLYRTHETITDGLGYLAARVTLFTLNSDNRVSEIPPPILVERQFWDPDLKKTMQTMRHVQQADVGDRFMQRIEAARGDRELRDPYAILEDGPVRTLEDAYRLTRIAPIIGSKDRLGRRQIRKLVHKI